MPVLIFGINDTAFAPAPFKNAHVNPRKFCQKPRIESRSSRDVTRFSIFTTGNEDNHCNATATYRSDYHKQLPCNANLSEFVFLHEKVATSLRTADSNIHAYTIELAAKLWKQKTCCTP